MLGQFSKNYRTFYQKNCQKALKIWSWDPGSGIRKKPIPDPGSRGQKAPNPGSRIWIRNTVYRYRYRYNMEVYEEKIDTLQYFGWGLLVVLSTRCGLEASLGCIGAVLM
jgi:hypothetical protein